MVSDDAIAAAVCRILSTAKTRYYVVTARGVMRELGQEIRHGRLRAVLRRFGFQYIRHGTADSLPKYVVDVESAKKICQKIREKKKSLF
ncbi:MAG: hypothetical protein ACO2PN_22415 [Pyrobaculum sp.]